MTVRDSGGIQIIENAVPSWKAGEQWTVGTTPTLDIGRTAGSPEYELSQVRNAVRFSDGRIALANMATSQIRFYDSAGTFLKSVGRNGNGPGEFEQLWRLRKISGDSLMALEPSDLTSIFTSDGRYIRRFRLDPAPGYTNMWWLAHLDGDYLVTFSLARIGTREVARDATRPPREGTEEARLSIPRQPVGYRDSLMHFLYSMEGRLVDTIGRFPSQWVGDQVVFAPNAAYASEGKRFFHSPGDRTEIREFELARGAYPKPLLQLKRIIRVASTRDLTVTDADKQTYIAGLRAMYKRDARMSDAQIDQTLSRISTPFAQRLPEHGNRMYVDATNALWLMGFSSDADAGAHWTIIDATGRFLGLVQTPDRFTVAEIGSDYILGIWRDSLDVEHVRSYPLMRQGR
jgi:hypothetical protein